MAEPNLDVARGRLEKGNDPQTGAERLSIDAAVVEALAAAGGGGAAAAPVAAAAGRWRCASASATNRARRARATRPSFHSLSALPMSSMGLMNIP